MTATDYANKQIGRNLKKISTLALLNYNRQSNFYKHCITPDAHINKFIQVWFMGFLNEGKTLIKEANQKAKEVKKNWFKFQLS